MTRAERQKEWEQRIAKYRASGQSVTEWCAANDVNPERLWYWLRKYKTPKETAPFMKSTQWLPVEISGQSPEQDSILIRVGAACIEVKSGFDPALLSGIVRVLATLC